MAMENGNRPIGNSELCEIRAYMWREIRTWFRIKLMPVNPYESPRPVPASLGAASLQDGRWSLVLTGLFAGGYVGAWVGSLSGAGVGVLFALMAGGGAIGYGDPALTFVEGLITTGLLIAVVGALTGTGLGVLVGGLLGSLVCVSREGLRQQFIWVSCLAACAAAIGLAVAMFCFAPHSQEVGPLAANQHELFARVAALCVIGLGGFFGGGLLGRILREVAWEPRAMVEVVANRSKPTME
jgi:hypothetical protein